MRLGMGQIKTRKSGWRSDFICNVTTAPTSNLNSTTLSGKRIGESSEDGFRALIESAGQKKTKICTGYTPSKA